MKLVPLNTLFDVKYGNQFDLYKLESDEFSEINFVSRSSQNLGVVAKVSKYNEIEPFSAGLISVTLGGTYLLSSFIQQSPFYTAQNVKVLRPKAEMTLNEKIFYCKAIEANRFRYTSHGREANTTLDSLLLPANVPENFLKIDINKLSEISDKNLLNSSLTLDPTTWDYFRYDGLFNITRGKGTRIKDITKGLIPFITSIDSNNGVCAYVDSAPLHEGNTITVTRNGSVAEAFYQPTPFCSTEDVHVFSPKFKLNKYIAFFLITLIKKEKYRYSFGRKWGLERMKESIIKLPIDKSGQPDWALMETYIKALPYSAQL
ncbi:hypothetical protein HDF26_004024 [Pedobacter cryoconitis]|uniref:restriction endonuclease subunit S n=1 Tax=Pedobacter cryoconitis TaxID=188932 RepID=UPI001609A524|nr:restriction endonuclease subunit S [Pedobacter cryoconitis]MBB6273564.1 hypothetical protein [Pedobacter cryoconitis]